LNSVPYEQNVIPKNC